MFKDNPTARRRFIQCYLVFALNGMLALSTGSLLPFIRDARGIDYAFAGILVSSHSIGNFVSSFVAGYLPIFLGRKKSIMFFNSFYAISYILILLTSNRWLLLLAFILTGISRGATSNFCNLEMNDLAPGKAWMLNGLHAMFAVGALAFPLISIAFTSSDASHWTYGVVLLIVMGVISFLLYATMPANESLIKKKEKGDKTAGQYDFFKEKLFYLTVFTLFFYLCAEQGVIGWMITYFKDTGLLDANLSQATASIQWAMILIGRLTAAYLSTKLPKQRLLVGMGLGMAGFYILLIMSHSTMPIIIGIMGFGFCMAGVYPTTVSFNGLLMEKYPMSWSYVLTFASLGSIIMPSVMGTIAENAGIAAGMTGAAAAIIIDLVFILLLCRYVGKRKSN